MPLNTSVLTHWLAEQRPAIDVRSPGEFAEGHLPGAVNLPILNDDERAQIGTTYRLEGSEAANALGHRLVSGVVRDTRITQWTAFLQLHPEAYLYCWRGGARSRIAAQWLSTHGFTPERIEGGYKALRQFCLQTLDVTPETTRDWWLLGGRTGSGKTELLHDLEPCVDLEALAEHRGSAFGGKTTPQPALATFENRVACALLARQGLARQGLVRRDLTQQGMPLVLEDESRTIGRLGIPEAIHRAMQRAPVVLLESDLPSRVASIQHEYVDVPLQISTPDAVERRFQSALTRIQRRLGGVRYKELTDEIHNAFNTGDHHRWIERLLTWYYDPMYDYQLEQKQTRIRFAGPAAAVKSFLAEQRRFPSSSTEKPKQ